MVAPRFAAGVTGCVRVTGTHFSLMAGEAVAGWVETLLPSTENPICGGYQGMSWNYCSEDPTCGWSESQERL